MPKPEYLPPPDPDFEKLAWAGYEAWKRDRPDTVAFDTETTGLAYYDAPFCVTAAWDGPDGIESHYFELVKFDTSKFVKVLLKNAGHLIGHNTKFDLQKCILPGLIQRGDLTPDRIEDTEAASQLVNEHEKKGLKDLMVNVLGWQETIPVEVLSGKNKGTFKEVVKEKHELEEAKKWAKKQYGLASVKDVGYDLLPRDILVPYAVMDAKGTLLLHKHFAPLLARYPEVVAKYREEMECALVLLDMEIAGMRADIPYVREQIRVYTKRVIEHDISMETIVGGTIGKDVKAGEFNPNSTDQLRVYFTDKGFPRESYDRENLTSIDHPLAAAIIARRKDEKLLGTYFKAMEREVGEDGILHASFRQHGARTGRMSSGGAEG